MEALLTSRTVVGSCLSYDDDESLVGTWTNLSTRSCSGSPYKLPGNTTLPQSYSYSALGSLSSCGGTPCRGQKSLMTDLDKRIYNSLGSTSSPIGKVGFIIIIIIIILLISFCSKHFLNLDYVEVGRREELCGRQVRLYLQYI